MTLSKEEIKAIMSIAAKIIKHQEEERLKKELDTVVRNSEDVNDNWKVPSVDITDPKILEKAAEILEIKQQAARLGDTVKYKTLPRK